MAEHVFALYDAVTDGSVGYTCTSKNGVSWDWCILLIFLSLAERIL
jgi:hypothetical protein